MIKQNELKIGMRVVGELNNSKIFSGYVYSINGIHAEIVRDDGKEGSGQRFNNYNTWDISCKNGYWHSDGILGKMLKISDRYDLFKFNIEKFNSVPDGNIFKSGICLIEHPWFNQCKKISEGGCLEEDGRSTKVKYVALKSGNTWAIFHSLDANFVKEDYLDSSKHLLCDNNLIAKLGSKMYNQLTIKELINCDEDVFALYRF